MSLTLLIQLYDMDQSPDRQFGAELLLTDEGLGLVISKTLPHDYWRACSQSEVCAQYENFSLTILSICLLTLVI